MKQKDTMYSVLVVEDNIGDYLLIEEYLTVSFFQINLTNARTYKEAEDKMSCGHQYDIILLDLSLVDLSGKNLIDQMLQIARDTPIVVLTGYADVEFSYQTLSKGISDYLLKDELDANILYKSIRYCLGRKEVADKLRESEKKYKMLFDLNPQPLCLVDIVTGKFIDVNLAIQNHFGFSSSEFMDFKFEDIFSTCTFEDEQSISDVFSGQEIVKAIKKDNVVTFLEIKRNKIYYQGIEAEIILCTDIFDKIKSIRLIEERNKKLEEITWIQSHLVRAPLTRIMGLTELINKKSSQKRMSPDQLISMLRASAKELDKVIREIVNKSEV